MSWSGSLRQALSPVLAIGIVAASLYTAVTHKPSLSPAVGSTLSSGSVSSAVDLWKAGEVKANSPVHLASLAETGDITGGAWIETRHAVATVGRVDGKLVVTREFGPSDEADAAQIVSMPHTHLVAITMGFKPFVSGSKDWFWARFTPDGKLLDSSGPIPSALQLAALGDADCNTPLSQEVAASG